MFRRVIIINILITYAGAANILGIFNHGSPSHHVLGEALLKELARRGHNCTMVSPFQFKEKIPNYTAIHLSGILEEYQRRQNLYLQVNHDLLNNFDVVLELTRTQTEITLNNTDMNKLVQSGNKFDLIIMDWFMNYALLIYGHIFQAPVIPISSFGTTAISRFMGNPSPPSYISSSMVPFPNNMSYGQRVTNSLIYVAQNFLEDVNIHYHDIMLKRYFASPPNFEELKGFIALILSNGHYSIEGPRPYVPNVIPVAGFHIETPTIMPAGLQKFMDEAQEGVIYFSLGSIMKSSSFSMEKQEAILKAFSKIKQKVLCLWPNKHLLEVPENVLLQEWLPQKEILGHPNLKLFISHGGLLSTIEAIYFAVPVIGIPIFGDQKYNIEYAVAAGYAIKIDFSDLNEIRLGTAIREMLTNNRFKENIRKRSVLLRDQPMSPMENAIFWVEHVIRHKGAAHLQNTGIYLKWYQYFLVDVICLVVGVLLTCLGIVYLICSNLYRLLKVLFQKEKTD